MMGGPKKLQIGPKKFPTLTHDSLLVILIIGEAIGVNKNLFAK